MIGFSNDVVCTMIFSFFLDCFFAVARSRASDEKKFLSTVTQEERKDKGRKKKSI